MRLAVLSDTHNNEKNLMLALEQIEIRGLSTLVHCGDITGPHIMDLLAGRDAYFVYGNIDCDVDVLEKKAQTAFGPGRFGRLLRLTLDGHAVGVCHGHDNAIDALVGEGSVEYLFHGHTHRRRDEMLSGVRVVNPGAIGGLKSQSRSFCVVDLEAGSVEFIEL